MSLVDGRVAPGFEAVRDAFAANFEADEIGAAVAVRVGGRSVVDLWGGFADRHGRKRWHEDTIVNCFSVGKGILSILALDCICRGEVDPDAAISTYWPAAARLGEGVTVRDCLSHRAGVPAIRRRLDPHVLYDWRAMCDALVDQSPYWKPGAAHGYHVNTFGFLVGEILSRATGTPVGELLRTRLSAPLRADFHFGLAAGDHRRVAETVMAERQLTTRDEWALAFPPTGDEAHDQMIWSAYFNPPGLSGLGTVNRPEWRKAVIPSTNSHGNARGIARLYSAVAGGGSIPAGAIAEATTAQSDGHDIVLGRPSRYGLGFQLPLGRRSLGPSPTAFGHYGYGGSLGLADPAHGLSFGYSTNKPGQRFEKGRTERILEAVYAAI